MIWLQIIYVLVGLIVGAILGFLIAKRYMKKFLKDNPPINEKMIKIMMQQMGRTPNQKQINQIMNAMNKQL